jgi:hypothetical protein
VALSPPRRRLLELFASIAILHGVAIAVYYALRVPRMPADDQRIFGWIWLGLTLVVLVVGLRRFHAARRAARYGAGR